MIEKSKSYGKETGLSTRRVLELILEGIPQRASLSELDKRKIIFLARCLDHHTSFESGVYHTPSKDEREDDDHEAMIEVSALVGESARRGQARVDKLKRVFDKEELTELFGVDIGIPEISTWDSFTLNPKANQEI